MRRQAYLYLGGGVLLAILSGIVLATQVAAGSLSNTTVFVGAALAFVPVLALEAYGLYLLAGAREVSVNNEMGAQRRLSDLLREGGTVTLDSAMERCECDAEQVLAMLAELAELRVFSSYVDAQRETLHVLDGVNRDTLIVCKACGSGALREVEVGRLCGTCGSVYYLA
jgi:hypothetical protein